MKKLKIVRSIAVAFLIFMGLYFIGPTPEKQVLDPELHGVGLEGERLEEYVANLDSGLNIRQNNHARIVWANDSTKEKTPVCLLYLHGFSASWFEGYPINQNFAERYGCNAYFARLSEQGLVSDQPLKEYTPEKLYESAKTALSVALSLGEKVVIMSCSTGGTLSLKLIADFPQHIAGQILYSPNIAVHGLGAELLSKPWGLYIGRAAFGGPMRTFPEANDCQYWDCSYRIEALVSLQQLLDLTMTDETFSKVKCPTFIGYYYRDEENQDPTVKVSAIQRMARKIGTDPDLITELAFPNSESHVICSSMKSKDWQTVQEKTFEFAENILKLIPVEELVQDDEANEETKK